MRPATVSGPNARISATAALLTAALFTAALVMAALFTAALFMPVRGQTSANIGAPGSGASRVARARYEIARYQPQISRVSTAPSVPT